MSENNNHNVISDEQLIGYIDGVLGPQEHARIAQLLEHDDLLRQRYDVFEAGSRPFKEAFDLILDQAPHARLQAMLDDTDVVVPLRRRGFGVPQMAMAASLLLAVFAGGLVAGNEFELPSWVPKSQAPVKAKGWRQTVAEYQSLYTKETLAGLWGGEQQQVAGLKRVSGRIGVEFSLAKVALAKASFKGARILTFKGKPLVQLAYLQGEQPLAFCVLKTGQADHGARLERRVNQNIVHWTKDGFSYMLIGAVPKDDLDQLAKVLEQRFS